MTLTELKAALIKLLKTKYPDFKYYSTSVMENYTRPCFFTQIKPVEADITNYNTRSNRVVFYVTYLAKKSDEAETLQMVDDIRDLFGLYVQVGERAVRVESYDWDFIGDDRNIPDISIGLYWYDRIEHKTDAPLIEEVYTKEELEEE